MEYEPEIAFRVDRHEPPALEVRVNFGVFAGREATPAEIDGLANDLRSVIDEFSIVADERHEFADGVEAAVHQVRIEAEAGDADRVVAIAERWAEACIAERHAEIAEL